MGNDRLANMVSDLMVFLAMAFLVFMSGRALTLRDLAILAGFWASWDLLFMIVLGRYRD